ARKFPAIAAPPLFAIAMLAFGLGLFATTRSATLRVSLLDPRSSVSQSLMRGLHPVIEPWLQTDASVKPVEYDSDPIHTEDGLVLPRAHVLLITIDALRADHLGVYGYDRPTSPHIDAL